MSRDKQIEEMAKIIGDNTEQDTMWPEIYDCANALYNAGYRKTSDIAREIFEEIENILDRHSIAYLKVGQICGEHYYDGVMQFDIAELKKKYTVTDTNVGCKDAEGGE